MASRLSRDPCNRAIPAKIWFPDSWTRMPIGPEMPVNSGEILRSVDLAPIPEDSFRSEAAFEIEHSNEVPRKGKKAVEACVHDGIHTDWRAKPAVNADLDDRLIIGPNPAPNHWVRFINPPKLYAASYPTRPM